MRSTSPSMAQPMLSSMPSARREQELWDKWATHMVEPPHWTAWQKPHWTDYLHSEAAPQWLVDLLVHVVVLTVFFSAMIGALAGLG